MNTLQGHPAVPSENWDDDFEFQQASSHSSPNSKRDPSSSSYPTTYRAPPSQSSLMDFEPSLPQPGNRISIASSHFTEDWDAESSSNIRPEDMNSSSIGYGHAHRSILTTDPPETPLSRFAASSMSSGPDTQSLDAESPYSHTRDQPPVTENWDDDFEDSMDSPVRPTFQTHPYLRPGLVSLDEEMASTPTKATAGSSALRIRGTGTGLRFVMSADAKDDNDERPESWDEEFELDALREQEKRERNRAKSTSEQEFASSPGKRRRLRKGKQSVGGYSTYSSSDEDYGDNDGTPVRPSAFHSKRLSLGFDDSEFGMGEKEEDKTVTARSRRRPFSRLLSSKKTGSPPPPVPSIPSQHAGPSFPSPPPSSALSAPPHTSPLPSSSQTSQSRLFQRSPNSSVFSIPLPSRSASSASNSSVATSNRSSSAHSHSQSHQIHAYSAQSAGADGMGGLETSQANGSLTHLLGLNLGGGRSRSSFLGILPPSPPSQEKRERRRLRKKSRPQSANSASTGRRSGVDDDPVDEFGLGGGEGSGSATVVGRGQRSGKQSLGGDQEWTNLTEGGADEGQDIEITSDSWPSGLRTPATPPPLHQQAPYQAPGKQVPSTPSGRGLPSPSSGGLLSRIGSVKRWGRRKRESMTPSEVEATEKGTVFPTQESEDITSRPPSSLSYASITGTPSSSSQHYVNSRPPLSNPGWFSRATNSSRTKNGSTSDLTSFDREMERRSMYSPTPDGGSHTETSKLVKRKSLGFVPLKRRMSHSANNSLGGGIDDRSSTLHRGREDALGGSSSARPLSMLPQSRHASYGTVDSSNTGRESVDDLVSRERSRKKSYSKSREREQDDAQAEGGHGFMGNVRKLSLVGRHKRTKSGLSLASVAAAIAAPTLAQLPGTPIATGSDPPSNAPPGSTSDGMFSDVKIQDVDVKALAPSSPEAPTAPRSPVYSAFPLSFSSGLTLDQNDDIHLRGDSIPEGAKSTALPAQNMLLPPIELHPPSPPHTSRELRSNTIHEESTTLRGLDAAILSTASASSPTSPVSYIYTSPSRMAPASPGENDAHRLNPEHDDFTRQYGIPPISPAKRSILGRSPKAPGPSQAVSLGRSTGGPVALLSNSVNAGSVLTSASSSTALRRNNSLGDLKIPARISQAQVGLRRDLGMVKEFASNIDQLRDLQKTYHSLVMEVQYILDAQAHMYAQQQQRSQQQKQLQPQSPSRAASPSFFANISSRKTRNRSNTNSTIAVPSSSTSTATQEQVPAQPSLTISTNSTTNMAYKQLASMFYTINSKYRISWECAELLIELGSGPNAQPPSTGPSSYRYKFAGSASGSGVGTGRPSSSAGIPSTSVSAPAMQNTPSGEGRERSVSLIGDELKPPPSPPYSGTISSSASTANVSSIPGSSATAGPPMPSPPSLGWRASTGRHDLSHRQLLLLKEMLNNSDSASASGLAGLLDVGMSEAPLHSRAIPEESATSLLLNINREWRWGDAMSSTITLPSEETNSISAMSPSGFGMGGVAVGLGLGTKSKGKRRLVGMSGLRSILRSLKRSHSDNHQTQAPPLPRLLPVPPHTGGSQEASPVQASATSLTTDESLGDGPGKHIYSHPLLPLPPPSTPPSDGNRRARTSTGPESDGVQTRPSSPYQSGSLTATKPSPRRPSLASVFRIGKTPKTGHAVPGSGTTSPYTANVSLESIIDEAVGPTSHTSGGGKLRKKFPRSRAGQIRADVIGDSASSVGDEEDWDRIDSASDLDVAVGRTGNEISPDVFATVRKSSGKGVKEHLMGIGRSPYMQKKGVGVFTGAISAEKIPSGTASRQASPQRRAVSGSHSSTSLWDNPSSNGSSHQLGVASSRPSRLSNVEEDVDRVKKGQSSQEPPPAPITSTAPPSSAGPAKSVTSESVAVSPTPRLKAAKSRGARGVSGPPDPKLAMTPENIRPLLENAREVRARLGECVAEIKALLASATASSVPSS